MLYALPRQRMRSLAGTRLLNLCIVVCSCEYRLHYAKLNGIPSGNKWEDYCPGMPLDMGPGCKPIHTEQLCADRVIAGDKGTPATINGYHLVKPVTCETGWLGVYGYVSASFSLEHRNVHFRIYQH